MTQRSPPVLFSYAFRVFFLFAGLYAFVALALWIAGFHGLRWPGAPADMSPLWHGHEMALGFGGAVVAAFCWPPWPPGPGARPCRVRG